MEWTDVIENPLLNDLPFKIELNKWGKIVMSPIDNQHGQLKAKMGFVLAEKNNGGKVIINCSIKTTDGVKVADVAWASDAFIAGRGFETPYSIAPEICLEVMRPSDSMAEMQERMQLYFNQGAREVWLCNQQGEISYYSSVGKTGTSSVYN